MTRPTILDLDLVVVPAQADVGMLGAWYRYKNGHRFAGEEPARDTSDVGAYSAMLSASPYHTAWDDVRKYIEGLEREYADSIARETDGWRRANRAESKVKAWEGFVVVRDLPRLAVPTKDFGPGEQDTVSVPKITPEKLTDIIDRAEAAEARIAELEKRLAKADVVVEPFADGRAKIAHANGCRYHGGHDCDCGKDDYLRAARSYMEGR